MRKIISQYNLRRFFIFIAVSTMSEPIFAEGLEKVNTFMDSIAAILSGVAITAVTIAIMWAGFKFLYKHAELMECGKIVIGGLLIGGAAELASYLVG